LNGKIFKFLPRFIFQRFQLLLLYFYSPRNIMVIFQPSNKKEEKGKLIPENMEKIAE
jgi:hypothetical protein